MKTTMLFNRNEGGVLATFAIVTFTCEQSQDPKVLMEKFKAAVTDWINFTDEGKAAWNYSCGDFNIGDFASYENDQKLNECLAKEGLFVKIDLMNDADNVLPFDTILANDIDEEDEEDDNQISNVTIFLNDELIWKVTDAVSRTSYDPDDAMPYFEESLTIAQANVMWAFLAWAYKNEFKFGKDNIVELMKLFYEVADAETQSYIDGKEVELDIENMSLSKVEVVEWTPKMAKNDKEVKDE